MTDLIVGIRFQKVGKIYHFNADAYPDLEVGDHVLVETSRGRQLGEVAQIIDEPKNGGNGSWKPVVRKATPRDLVTRQIWQKKEIEAVVNCQAKVANFNLEGIKIISAEFTLDGKRLTMLYTSEGDDKVDLTGLQKDMQRHYDTQVDFHRIGPRDAAKIIGGMGACGMDERCCSKFMTDFCPISIKMAKAQGVSLAPSEITGMCGRLRCCLKHEYEFYVEARKNLPKRKKRVSTPLGDGRVIKSNPIKNTILVSLEDRGTKEFPVEEVHLQDNS